MASVETLRRLLGHSSMATTGRYLDHLGMADLRDALAPLPRYEGSSGGLVARRVVFP